MAVKKKNTRGHIRRGLSPIQIDRLQYLSDRTELHALVEHCQALGANGDFEEACDLLPEIDRMGNKLNVAHAGLGLILGD